jgi:hypothetical protein
MMATRGYQSVTQPTISASYNVQPNVNEEQARYLHLQREQAPLLPHSEVQVPVKQRSSSRKLGACIFGCLLCFNIFVCCLIGLAAIIDIFVVPPFCIDPSASCQMNMTLAPKSAMVLDLSKYDMPTNYYKSISVQINDANNYDGTVGVALQQKDMAECTRVPLNMEMTFTNGIKLVRVWNYKTKASGTITCENSDSYLSVFVPLLGYHNFDCGQGAININELYNNILFDIDDESGIDLPVLFFMKPSNDDDQIRASVDITECLPIPHHTDGYYKEIQLNESVTFQLGSYFSEKYPETQSRLVVNSLGMQSLDGNYNAVMLQIDPSGFSIGRLIFILIPAPLFLCNIIPIIICIGGFSCKK